MVQAIATTACRNSKAVQNSAFLKRHLPALELMLWGGTVMLIVDHIINGELTWRFPFLTALDQIGGYSIVLREMLTVGLPMSLVLTAAWGIWALLKDRRQSVRAPQAK